MINEVKNWRNFINEREREVQDKYKAEFILSLRQEKDVDRGREEHLLSDE